jgi:hypothetical protein
MLSFIDLEAIVELLGFFQALDLDNTTLADFQTLARFVVSLYHYLFAVQLISKHAKFFVPTQVELVGGSLSRLKDYARCLAAYGHNPGLQGSLVGFRRLRCIPGPQESDPGETDRQQK